MLILKFGGTSLGNPERIKSAAEIVAQHSDCIVVCSAMAGMTNSLLRVTEQWERGHRDAARLTLQDIQDAFHSHCLELLPAELFLSKTVSAFDEAYLLLEKEYNPLFKSSILALGEQLTSFIFQRYLSQTGIHALLLDAPSFLRLNEHDEPNVEDISRRLANQPGFSSEGVFVTQGYICSDAHGNIATLSRGGSDFSATLMGAATEARCIEIWTDIDGMHNNDPRHVDGTQPLRELSYAEAAELAYFGAKILHPSCVRPAREMNIPIRIKNTLNPKAPGTLIGAEAPSRGIRAIAAKDGITILRITSGRMFNAYGFLARVFEIFRDHKTPVDVVTTSEVSVSVTIEDTDAVMAIKNDLLSLGRVDLEYGRSIICLVGDVLQPGHLAGILQLIKKMNIRMVSLGASSNNITFVLPEEQKAEALNALHSLFRRIPEETIIPGELSEANYLNKI